MKNLILIVFVMLNLNNCVQGQNGLASAGNNQYSTEIQQSYTLGEPFVSENIVGSVNHSKGFQQPEIPVFNLRMFIQGFYLDGGLMTSVIDPINFPLLTDTVTISFVNIDLNTTPVFERKALLQTNGWSTTNLPTALFGHSYYLKINHRNSIETWSKFPIPISTANRYDLTTP
jgi:hypothetical protein